MIIFTKEIKTGALLVNDRTNELIDSRQFGTEKKYSVDGVSWYDEGDPRLKAAVDKERSQYIW